MVADEAMDLDGDEADEGADSPADEAPPEAVEQEIRIFLVDFFDYCHIILLFLSHFLPYGPHILDFIYSLNYLICILFWYRNGTHDNIAAQDRLSIERVKIMSLRPQKNKIKKRQTSHNHIDLK